MDNYIKCNFWHFKKMLGPVHLLPKMDKWEYLRIPIIDFFFVSCFDIGEVPRSPWKWNWNWLYFLPLFSLSNYVYWEPNKMVLIGSWEVFERLLVEFLDVAERLLKYFCKSLLTAVLFETGAKSVPTKSRNPTICGWAGPFHLYLTHSWGFCPFQPF